MRVLHVANLHQTMFGRRLYPFDRRLSIGLCHLNHAVYDFSYRDIARFLSIIKSKRWGSRAMNLALLETIEKIEPELLLLGHTELLTAATLKKIKQNYPSLPIAMWYVDPLWRAQEFIDRLSWIDAFFATSSGEGLYDLQQYTEGSVNFIPNICDVNLDCFRAFEVSNGINFSFIGSTEKHRNSFIDKISSLAKNPQLQRFGQSRATRLNGINYYKTIGQTHISLNYSRDNDVRFYTSDRHIHLAANGSMVLCPEIPDFKRLFSDQEQVYFDNSADLIDKLHYYSEHSDERKKIAKAGWQRAHQSFNAKRVAQYLLETLFVKNYSEAYEWIDTE